MASNYERSIDAGKTWSKITRTEARKILRKTTTSVGYAFDQIDEGRIFNASGWGWVRRKPGRWNKGELSSNEAKAVARMLLSETDIPIPMAVAPSDVKLIQKHLQSIQKAEVDKLSEQAHRQANQYLKKIKEYSP